MPQEICRRCDGTGEIDCRNCDGTGEVPARMPIAAIQGIMRPCPVCGGSGREPCPAARCENGIVYYDY